MTLPSGWSELHRTRFREVPENCGNLCNPGVLDLPQSRDWSSRDTTADQRRIESYLSSFDLRKKRLLHIGVGNSGLARRFSGRVGEIIGITIEANEAKEAQLRGIPNYKIVLQNKYAAQLERTPGKFDFIIDNNPLSFCCCMAHLVALFDFYKAKLASDGQIVTDQQGLSWVAPAAHPLFQMDFRDLNQLALQAGFSASKIDRNIYVLGENQLPNRARDARTVWKRINRAIDAATSQIRSLSSEMVQVDGTEHNLQST